MLGISSTPWCSAMLRAAQPVRVGTRDQAQRGRGRKLAEIAVQQARRFCRNVGTAGTARAGLSKPTVKQRVVALRMLFD